MSPKSQKNNEKRKRSKSVSSVHTEKKKKKSKSIDVKEDSEVTIKVVASQSSLSKNKNPIVVSFPGGFPQSVIQNDDVDHNNNNNNGTQPEFVWRRLHAPPNDAKPDTPKKNKDDENYEKGRRVVGRDRTCTYESVLPRKAPTKTHRLCVGVLDKRSGILRVSLAADDGHVFALEQSVIGYKDNGGDATTTPSKLKSAAERHRALFSSFGSSKKRKVLKSQEANRVTVDTTVGGLSSAAFANQTKMSESNRKALQDQKSLQQDGQNREPVRYFVFSFFFFLLFCFSTFVA